MQNLKTHSISTQKLSLPYAVSPAQTLYESPTGQRQLFSAVPASETSLTLHAVTLPPTSPSSTEDIPISTAFNSLPNSLCVLDDNLLLATRAGELFTINPTTAVVEPVGEVIDDEDQSRSGVLTATSSPDANLVVIISPVKTLVLDAALDLRAEIPHPNGLAHAAQLSWRADGEFFVVVLTGPDRQLTGIVVDRECANVKELDLHDAMEMPHGNARVAWEPRVGGIITLSTGSNRLLFFERNGLRHLRSDFDLPHAAQPRLLGWSVDSRMLTVVQDGEDDKSNVSIFMRCNYKWYCKKVVRVKGEVVMVHWDEDIVNAMGVFTREGLALFLRLRTVPGDVFDVSNGAHAFVLDGRNVCVTNLTKAVLPPPMNHGVIQFTDAVEDVCGSPTHGFVGALLANGDFELFEVGAQFQTPQVECVPRANGNVAHKQRNWTFTLCPDSMEYMPLRFPVFVSEDLIVAVRHSRSHQSNGVAESESLQVYQLAKDRRALLLSECSIEGSVRVMSNSVRTKSVVMATSTGTVVQVEFDEQLQTLTEIARFETAVSGEAISICDYETSGGRCLTLVHDENGILKALELSTEKMLYVSRECTSFCLQDGFLSFTTASHLMYCALLDKAKTKSYDGDRNETPSIADSLDGAPETVTNDVSGLHLAEGKGATRPVDRGSLIVTAIPKDVSVVLQAPRGNLETVCPRPIVFEAVDMFAKRAQYSDAFSLCRRQRVDMNHLVDANFELFLENVQKFVSDVEKASHLSIFLTFLRGERAKINAVCDAVVRVLKENERSGRYVSTILTALMRRDPPAFADALDRVRQAWLRSEEEGKGALDYLFVLIKDEEKVYKEALGTYDLQLALFVAKSSQMDPAEYSYELKNLSSLNQDARKYEIDIRLERYEKALRHLYACGESRHKECIALCHQHALYETAIDLFRDNKTYQAELLDGFGKHLLDTNRFEEAAPVFIRNGDWEQASLCYRSGGLWQRAASAAWRCQSDDRGGLLESLVEELTERGKIKEAARVRLTHLGDTEGAIELLAVAGEWEEMFDAVAAHCAMESLSEHGSEDMNGNALWEKVTDLVVEGSEAILSTVRENGGKLRDRRKRLETVREAKREISARLAAKGMDRDEEDSDAFSSSTASSLVSNLSDVTFTSRTSATSVYSTATGGTGPMSAAKLEKQAEKRRRKAARKRIREGHPREEEYLVGYLKKLVPNAFLRQRVRNVGAALMFLGKTEVVKTLMKEMSEYVEEAGLLPADILGSEELREAVSDRSWLDPAKFVDLL